MKNKDLHVSVLLKEAVLGLALKKGARVIDGTLGGGGHSKEILKQIGESGKLLGIDLDNVALEKASQNLKEYSKNFILKQGNFAEMDLISENLGWKDQSVDAIILDLGFSSFQMDDLSRGFSFESTANLDMRFCLSSGCENALDIVNTWSKEDLEKILREYGEEERTKKIVVAILEARLLGRIEKANDLASIIEKACGGRRGRIHPATKTFQALRIAVNDELNNLKKGLKVAWKMLKIGGRISVVSFHSLEDKIVKGFFLEKIKGCVCPPDFPICNCNKTAELKLINKKIIRPGEEEIQNNPRSRSAKLRIAEKIK